MVHIDLNSAKVIHEKWKESILVGRFLLMSNAVSDHLSVCLDLKVCARCKYFCEISDEIQLYFVNCMEYVDVL